MFVLVSRIDWSCPSAVALPDTRRRPEGYERLGVGYEAVDLHRTEYVQSQLEALNERRT
ncbi:MAG: hypothetical protein RQ731_07970 [Anaerosomatales bacterium]|nr:hypothetical protein [Anaerosomatales bacterium]